jgi:hypothetical protein
VVWVDLQGGRESVFAVGAALAGPILGAHDALARPIDGAPCKPRVNNPRRRKKKAARWPPCCVQ